MILMLFLTACGSKETEKVTVSTQTEIQTEPQTEIETTQEMVTEGQTAEETKSTEAVSESKEEDYLKLYIDEREIPVTWLDNDTVTELMEEAGKKDILVSMSMYSDNEQVGPLGKSYSRKDKQTTTHCGDIVLYSGNQIVVFYGSNSWAYTRLGKMELSDKEVRNLLSNGDVTLRICY